jgi:hypothetical protein
MFPKEKESETLRVNYILLDSNVTIVSNIQIITNNISNINMKKILRNILKYSTLKIALVLSQLIN